MQIDFLKPARMDEMLDIVTWPLEVRGASITLRRKCGAAPTCWSRAQVRVAFICDGRAQAIPKALRALMKADVDQPCPGRRGP